MGVSRALSTAQLAQGLLSAPTETTWQLPSARPPRTKADPHLTWVLVLIGGENVPKSKMAGQFREGTNGGGKRTNVNNEQTADNTGDEYRLGA